MRTGKRRHGARVTQTVRQPERFETVEKVHRIREPSEFDYEVLAFLREQTEPVHVGAVVEGLGSTLGRVRLSLGVLRFAGLTSLDRVHSRNLWTALDV